MPFLEVFKRHVSVAFWGHGLGAGLADRLNLKILFQLKLHCDAILLFRQMSHTCPGVATSVEQQSWHQPCVIPALCPRALPQPPEGLGR